MVELPLFVFGTLCRGRRNHRLLEDRYDRMLPAVLSGFARQNPLMIARREGGEVDGELYFLRPADYRETMAECDLLEGIPPGKLAGNHYRRLEVSVVTAEGEHTAWAYVHRATQDE